MAPGDGGQDHHRHRRLVRRVPGPAGSGGGQAGRPPCHRGQGQGGQAASPSTTASPATPPPRPPSTRSSTGLDAGAGAARSAYKKVRGRDRLRHHPRRRWRRAGWATWWPTPTWASSPGCSRTEPADFAVEASGQIRADLLKGKTGQIWFSDLFRVTPLGIGPDQLPGHAADHLLPDRGGGAGRVSRSAPPPGTIGDVYFLQVSGIEVDYTDSNALFQRVTGARHRQGRAWPRPGGDTTGCYKVVSTLYLAALFGAGRDAQPAVARSVKPRLKDCRRW